MAERPFSGRACPPRLFDNKNTHPDHDKVAVDPIQTITPAAQFAKANSTQDRAAIERAAKDFESVLLGKLLESMKDSVGDWGGMTDGVGKQVYDIFWQYLAKDIADNGGIGLWKDIQRSMARGAYAQAGEVKP